MVVLTYIWPNLCLSLFVRGPLAIDPSGMYISRSNAALFSRNHDDVIKWKYLPRYWPFVRGIHRSLVNSSHKGQWRGALMFSLICAWINGWINNYEAGDWDAVAPIVRHSTGFDSDFKLWLPNGRYSIFYDVIWLFWCLRCYIHMFCRRNSFKVNIPGNIIDINIQDIYLQS